MNSELKQGGRKIGGITPATVNASNESECKSIMVPKYPKHSFLNTDRFIARSRSIHGRKYDYSKVNYVNNELKVIIICPKHGEFNQTPHCHLRGYQCRACSDAEKINTQHEFITAIIKKHGHKYDYSNVVYKGKKHKIQITCKLHGDFIQHPNSHLNGKGCPKCKQSKTETIIQLWLEAHKIRYVSQKIFQDCRNPETNYPLKFDFFIPHKNLLIEYDGPQHYKICRIGKYTLTPDSLRKIQFRDKIKTKYAKSQGIGLVRIKYTQSRNMDELLAAAILPSRTTSGERPCSDGANPDSSELRVLAV
jgi:hypothetical protein